MGIFLLTGGKMCTIIKHRKAVVDVYVHLKELRESLGMTQAEFGKSVGIAKSTYNNYEKGIREPKSDFWVSVAQKYNVTIDYLMGYSDDPHRTTAMDSIEHGQIQNIDRPLSKFEQELIEMYLKLDDRARSALLGYANRLAEEMRNEPAEQDIQLDIDSKLEMCRRGLLLGIATAQAEYTLPPKDFDVDSMTLTPELKAMVDSTLEKQRRIFEAEQRKK